MKNKGVLIIAPHPDDDILGCGGVMHKFASSGNNVYVAIMTNGNKGAPELFSLEGTIQGRKEAKKSHEVLGVKETFFFDFPTIRLESFPAYKISAEIEGLIRKLNIGTLFIPHRGDIHKDHRIIFEAALVAARPINNTPVTKILAYETLSETEWAAPYSDAVFSPNVFFELSNENIEKKLEAFNCYSPPRKKEFPHGRSVDGIKNLAQIRGSTISCYFAESFMLVREIV